MYARPAVYVCSAAKAEALICVGCTCLWAIPACGLKGAGGGGEGGCHRDTSRGSRPPYLEVHGSDMQGIIVAGRGMKANRDQGLEDCCQLVLTGCARPRLANWHACCNAWPQRSHHLRSTVVQANPFTSKERSPGSQVDAARPRWVVADCHANIAILAPAVTPEGTQSRCWLGAVSAGCPPCRSALPPRNADCSAVPLRALQPTQQRMHPAAACLTKSFSRSRTCSRCHNL